MASKTDVWMPLYIADYLADTNRLTTLQHGAYMLLIMDYWRNGALPDDDSILAQVAKMQPDAWSIARAVLVRFFSIENGSWVHARIEAEMAKAGENSEKAHARAVKAAEARWGKENATSIAQALLEDVLEECPSPSPSPSPINTPLASPTPSAGKSKDLSAPTAQTSKKGARLPADWVLPKSWGDWAVAEKPDWSVADIRRVSEDFRDHWISKAGKDATKLDWLATWRKWVRSPLNQVKPTMAKTETSNQSAREDARVRLFGGNTNAAI